MQESLGDFSDLMQASESSTEFWDNPIDDLGMERCLIERQANKKRGGESQSLNDVLLNKIVK